MVCQIFRGNSSKTEMHGKQGRTAGNGLDRFNSSGGGSGKQGLQYRQSLDGVSNIQGQQQKDGSGKQGLIEGIGQNGFKYTGATAVGREWETGVLSRQRPDLLQINRGNSAGREWETGVQSK